MNKSILAETKSGSKTAGNKHHQNIPPPTAEQVRLLNALHDGDPQAFEEIYLAWRKPVLSLMTKILRSADDAEDITQEVFIQLWNNRRRIETDKDIRIFIFLLARQAASKLIRRNRLKDTFLSSEITGNDTANDSSELLIAKEVEILVRLAVSRMPEKQREVYLLKVEDGLSNKDIADKLGVSPSTVSSHLHEAKKFLKEVVLAIMIVFFAIR